MGNILVIDDDMDICMLLQRYLSKNGFSVSLAYSGKSALQNINEQIPDLILCDFRMEDMTGGELLEKVKEIHPEIPFIIMTGYSDVRTAVSIMKFGAFDYVTKPLLPEEILMTIRKALGEDKEGATGKKTENLASRKTKKVKSKYIFGKSQVFKVILDQIHLVAPTNYSVIIYGESGSGKESVANEIHNQSNRSHKPFVAIDCGALSKELAGSELFGHEKGAFTGALNQKIGSFEIANGGTIFLDEIANLPYDTQVALLRVVQERKMKRLGSVKDIDLDVRIIVASNERLSEAARNGKFREDLYHRFNEFSMEVPALRNRQEDLMMFANHFLEQTNAELDKDISGFSDEVIEIFRSYPWPGNLRELNNVVKRSTLLSQGDIIESSSLPFEIIHYDKLNFENDGQKPVVQEQQSQPEQPRKNLPLNDLGMKHASIDAEFEIIVEALKNCNYNKSKAAQLLNIDRKTLYNKMKQYKEFNGAL